MNATTVPALPALHSEGFPIHRGGDCDVHDHVNAHNSELLLFKMSCCVDRYW